MSKAYPSKDRPFPSIVRVAAYCVNPDYRNDYKMLYQQGDEKKKRRFYKKHYPTSASKPIDPFALTDERWINIARRQGKLLDEDLYFLARLDGSVEDPDIPRATVYGTDNPVMVIPAWWNIEKHSGKKDKKDSGSPVGVPDEAVGYDPHSMKNLLGGRYLYLKLDLLANDDILVSRVKNIFMDYKRRMGLEGRRREEKMKYLALFHVAKVAKARKTSPQTLLDEVRFARKSSKNQKQWEALTKDISRAKKEARSIFRELRLPG